MTKPKHKTHWPIDDIENQGRVVQYFTRLRAAEAVCEHVEQLGCSNGAEVSDLLLAWRKAKKASEEEK